MKSILPCLTPFAWLAIATAAIAQATDATSAVREPPSAGDQLLLQAIAELERHESVAARLRHQSSLGGRRTFGAGSYWQQGSGDQLRVRLELQIAGGETSLLEVSNGRFLWIDRRLPSRRTVSRVDLRRLRADAARAAAKIADQSSDPPTWSPFYPQLGAYHGGLPKLLASLAESFSFDEPQAMRLTAAPAGTSPPTSLPVYATVGRWKRGPLAAILAHDADDRANEYDSPHPSAALPQRVPQEVLVLLGQADLFPYRVEYRQRVEPPSSAGTPAAYRLSSEPLVLVEFSDVSFGAPIGPGQFDYSPGDSDWSDRTAEYLDKLRRQREARVAAARSEPTM